MHSKILFLLLIVAVIIIPGCSKKDLAKVEKQRKHISGSFYLEDGYIVHESSGFEPGTVNKMKFLDIDIDTFQIVVNGKIFKDKNGIYTMHTDYTCCENPSKCGGFLCPSGKPVQLKFFSGVANWSIRRMID